MLFKTLSVGLLATVVAASSSTTVYLIRHGEKPSSGNGLTTQGEERAECLINVFGADSAYDIQYIMAETPQSDGSQERPYLTVLPLATSLNMTIDTSCSKEEPDCVASVVENYTGPGNILICWEHDYLTDIVEALGDSDAPTYPGADFNLIWTDPYPYTSIVSITSEDCPGLDVSATTSAATAGSTTTSSSTSTTTTSSNGNDNGNSQ